MIFCLVSLLIEFTTFSKIFKRIGSSSLTPTDRCHRSSNLPDIFKLP
ncbi:hypothetical protein [Arcobacter sp. CECT 8989]|nr:hypothetical protein [Arcobacter sp. CECT 8989]